MTQDSLLHEAAKRIAQLQLRDELLALRTEVELLREELKRKSGSAKTH